MNQRLAVLVFAAIGVFAAQPAFAQCTVHHLELVPNPADNLVAGAELLVTVTARDAANNVMPCYRGSVQLSADFNYTPPVHHTFTEADAGVYTFSWNITAAGERALNVYDAANALSTYFNPYTVVPGPIDVEQTQISLHRMSDNAVLGNTHAGILIADGLSMVRVKVTLRDAHQNPQPSGGDTVTLSTPGGSVGPVTDNGDGTYTAILTSGLVPGTFALTAMVNGQPASTDIVFATESRRDFNRDNKADILWRETATGQLILWTMNGGTILQSRVVHHGGNTAWTIEGVGDFDRDGDSDILWRNGSWILVWLLEDATIVSSTSLHTNVGPEWIIGAVADYDNDGRSDVLFRNNTTNQFVLWYLNGNTIGSTSTHAFNPFDQCGDDGAAYAGTTTTYGKNAFGTWRYSEPRWGTSCLPLEYKDGWDLAALGDFDASGTTDMLWRNLTSGATELRRGHNKYFRLHAGNNQSWSVMGAADFTGDNVADILWRNDNTGATLLWELRNLYDIPFGDPNAHILSSTMIHHGGNLGYQIVSPRLR